MDTLIVLTALTSWCQPVVRMSVCLYGVCTSLLSLVIIVQTSLCCVFLIENFAQVSQICQPNQFQCTDYSRCLSGEHYCDNRTQCADGSDEQDCCKCLIHELAQFAHHCTYRTRVIFHDDLLTKCCE